MNPNDPGDPLCHSYHHRALHCDKEGCICDCFLSWYEFKFYMVTFKRVAESGNATGECSFSQPASKLCC